MTQAPSVPWPTGLVLNRGQNRLEIVFDDGQHLEFGAEFLRVMTPSAADRGHGPKLAPGLGGKLVAGKSGVRLEQVTPIGRYAARLGFSDGHDTGLYTWAFLLQLGAQQSRLWADYLAALEAANLSREP